LVTTFLFNYTINSPVAAGSTTASNTTTANNVRESGKQNYD